MYSETVERVERSSCGENYTKKKKIPKKLAAHRLNVISNEGVNNLVWFEPSL